MPHGGRGSGSCTTVITLVQQQRSQVFRELLVFAEQPNAQVEAARASRVA